MWVSVRVCGVLSKTVNKRGSSVPVNSQGSIIYYTVVLLFLVFPCSCFSAPRRRVALFSVRPQMRTVRVHVGGGELAGACRS